MAARLLFACLAGVMLSGGLFCEGRMLQKVSGGGRNRHAAVARALFGAAGFAGASGASGAEAAVALA